MNYFKGLTLIVVIVAVVIGGSAVVSMGAPKESDCQKEENLDKRHLCLAKISEQTEGDPKDKNRYQNKDHSSYYCSLIGSRDLQNYCYAVIEKNPKRCELIANGEMEKECKSSI